MIAITVATAAALGSTIPARADSATTSPSDAATAVSTSVPHPGLKPPAPERPRGCSGQRFIGQRVACFSDRAVQAGDASVCFQASAPDVRWPCIAKYAVVAGDATTCRLLPGPRPDGVDGPLSGGEDTVTVDLCLSTLALVYRRPDLCRQIQTETMDDACLAKLVANGADPALCAGIDVPELRRVCRPDPLQEARE
ncbi:hypothetical protein [Rhodovibrio salinarum]|uniref:Secreted protein n=1 Tax=Rhodovibrio salinarum TaxID=1087 RepID=A0A934QGW6_9PROT|nr:hypothetical protein [Rhodovibrio salinarum]MBK1696564.1 hypothetical protein [Rhodovibrio salinarum]